IRTGTTWAQQGPKLVGAGSTGPWGANQGFSVSLSADGNTAISSGPNDSTYNGAVWIFSRSDTTWTQQGHKLVVSGAGVTGLEGISVSISADGNTAMEGRRGDSSTGAVWIFSRSGTTWLQSGNKLVGIGSVGFSEQGCS